MEIKKMIELTDKLLQMQQGKPGLPSYTGDSKRLINEIADLAENTLVWEWNRADAREFTRNMTTVQMWQHFKKKYINTVSPMFKTAAIVGMIPAIRCRLAFKSEIGEALHFE